MEGNKFDKYNKEKREEIYSKPEVKEIANFIKEILQSEEILRLSPRGGMGYPTPETLVSYGVISDDDASRLNYHGKFGIAKWEEERGLHIEDHTYRIFGNNEELVLRFATKLSTKYMVAEGFIYNSKKKILEKRESKDIKKITRKSLENCLKEYFINPLSEMEIDK
ncbi:MAG: hypothetical protein PF542_02725 [Nanoarchaeota archaeon]|jgi:hypothetical protein|nr:hypothetical protein [Nanoarchaeota archaeon]